MSNSVNSSGGGSGIGRGLRILGVLQTIFFAAALILYFAFPSIHLVSLGVLVLGTTLVLCGLVDLITAKKIAMRSDGDPVQFWKGFAELVSWNPTKGVLFLKNKHIHFVDSDSNDGGGIRREYRAHE